MRVTGLYLPAQRYYPATTMNARIREIVILAVGLALVLGADHGVAAEGRAQHERQADGQDHDLTDACVHRPRRVSQPGRPAQSPDTSLPLRGVH